MNLCRIIYVEYLGGINNDKTTKASHESIQ